MAAPGGSSQLLPRPPTGALRPPVAIGPADVDDADSRRGAPAPGSALSLPSADVLRPPVAMGPSDMDDNDGYFRKGLVDRNLSLSSKTSFRTEGSGYNPWISPPAGMANAAEAPGYIGESMTVSGGWGIAETGFDPATLGLPSQVGHPRNRDSPRRLQRPDGPGEPWRPTAKSPSVGFSPNVVSIQLSADSERNGEQQNFVSGGAVASSAPAGSNQFGSMSAREWSLGGMGNLNAGIPRRSNAPASLSAASNGRLAAAELAAAALPPATLPAASRLEPVQNRLDTQRVQQAPIVVERPQPFSAIPRANSRSHSAERLPSSAVGSFTASPPASLAGEGQELLYREQQFRAGQDEYRRNVAFSLAEEWAATSRPFEVSRTPAITYPGGMSVNFQDQAYSFLHVATANAFIRPSMLQTIETGDFKHLAMQMYKACDKEMNGFLSWNDGEIVNFVVSVFQYFGLTPPSESQIFQLYAHFDSDRSMFLGARECLCLVDALFRSIFIFDAQNIPRPSSNPGGLYNLSQSPSSGPTAATFILTPPPSGGAVVAYNPAQGPPPSAWDPSESLPPNPAQPPPGGPSWNWPHMRNPPGYEGPNQLSPDRVVPGPEAGAKMGAGEWPVNDWSWAELGSMFGFGNKSGQQQKPMGMAPPPADALLGQLGPADPQVRPYQIFRAPGGGDVERVDKGPGWDVQAGEHRWPEEAWSWGGLGSIFGSQKGAAQQELPPAVGMVAQPGKLADQCPACGNVYLEGSLFCRRCGVRRPEARGAPPADLLPPPKQPNYKKADIDPTLLAPAPQASTSMPKASHAQASPSEASRPSRPEPAPEVPKWRAEVELRNHVLEVDLEELRILHHSPDLTAAWYQSTSYYVSFHPTSEPPDDISLPIDAPTHTVEGKHLVSKSQSAKKPPVDNGHPVASIFKEKLKLTTDFLDQQLACFVWGRKASLAAEELVLIGMFVIPLFDFGCQRRVVTWKVMDPTVDKPIGELLMRHEVYTTPGPVQLPLLSEVKRTEVSLHWTAPLNDHGSPLIGYKISILVTPKLEGGLMAKLRGEGAQTGPQWVTLDACTKALTPAYVIKELEGNTTYMVNIQAVNVVGPGDPCEFQIQTAPIEPKPPRKPWIQEARDGCLCVAWHASIDDGGSPVTAYRVQMMKNVSMASRLVAMFGKPAEGDAAWVNMGTVGAVMDEVKDQPSVYTVWAGPLDKEKCEYRFRVYAINSAGVSLESEMTDPHYT